MASATRSGHDGTPITRWLIGLTFLTIVSGMAYSLWWLAVIRHTSSLWLVPGDIWVTVRSAHWVDEGLLSYLYSDVFRPVTLPGIQLLLAPVVAIGSALGLSVSIPHYALLRPTDWLLVGPVTMACAAVALFGFDSLAWTLGVPAARRRVLAVAETAALWPTIVIWGHPEDVVAMGLCALSLSRLLRGRHVSAAWLLGAALAMQLYVLAVVPVFLGILGVRRALPFLTRAAVIPGVLFLALVIPNPHATLHVLLEEPTYPRINFPTPWVLVAPVIGKGVVAGGPARLVGFAVDAALGVVAFRRRADLVVLVWLAAAALSTRCLFEAVMCPYYVGPAIGFAMLAATRTSWSRWAAAGVASAGLIVLTYYRPGIWWYWLEMAAVFVVLLLVSCPYLRRRERSEPTIEADPSFLSDELHPQPEAVPLGVLR